MRQVLVGKTKLVKDISFNTATLGFGVDTILSSGLNMIQVPFDIKPLHGGNIDFKFELTQTLGLKHILLVGAHHDPNTDYVSALFYNLTDLGLTVTKETPVLIAGAFETVMLRQVDEPKVEVTPEPEIKSEPTAKPKKTKKHK